MNASTPAPAYQRNALLPGFIAAAILMVAAALVGTGWFTIIRFLVAILALIVMWFAIDARQWGWVPVFASIAILWNPIFPLAFHGILWVIAQPLAAPTFLFAGVFIKQSRHSHLATNG